MGILTKSTGWVTLLDSSWSRKGNAAQKSGPHNLKGRLALSNHINVVTTHTPVSTGVKIASYGIGDRLPTERLSEGYVPRFSYRTSVACLLN